MLGVFIAYGLSPGLWKLVFGDETGVLEEDDVVVIEEAAIVESLSVGFFFVPRLSDDNERGKRDKNAGVEVGATTVDAAAATTVG